MFSFLPADLSTPEREPCPFPGLRGSAIFRLPDELHSRQLFFVATPASALPSRIPAILPVIDFAFSSYFSQVAL